MLMNLKLLYKSYFSKCPVTQLLLFANIHVTVIIRLCFPAGAGDSKGQTPMKHLSRDQVDVQETSLKCQRYNHWKLHGAKWKIQRWIKWISLWCESDMGAYTCPAVPICSPELLYDASHLHSWRLLRADFTKHAEAKLAPYWLSWVKLKIRGVSVLILGLLSFWFTCNSQRILVLKVAPKSERSLKQSRGLLSYKDLLFTSTHQQIQKIK